MDQLTFSEAEYQIKKRKTRREVFLERMDKLIPWKQLEKKVARHYPKGQNSRPPYPLSAMLRVHCMQLFYNLSDPAMEDALYEIESMRQFAGLKLDRLPDETTILKFRHRLEQKGLGKVLFKEVNKHLEKNGLMFREGSIVDATIIAAPSSTKNEQGERDPEMHQTRKGKQWHFGIKMHIAVDNTLGLIHSIDTTAANVHDIVPSGNLLHGEEQRVFGDAGYLGIHKRAEHKPQNASWFIAKRPGARKKLDANKPKAEKIKASIRAKVEHPFRYIKQVFGYSKVRYRGLAKNSKRLHLLA
ncbi:MAG: IS5 family transposase [Marinobacter sp.]|nr:IS5 family transposase [Marinobacter sp.]